MSKFTLDSSLLAPVLKNSSGSPHWEWKEVLVAFESENRKFTKTYRPFTELPQLQVSLSRSFLYDPKKGWFWHKSWILPTLVINFENSNISQSLAENLFVEVFAVIESDSDTKTFEKEMIDVGIKGANKMAVKKGRPGYNMELKFNALKFDSTSYNSEKKKFHLLVILYEKSEKKHEFAYVSCKVSPPIYVDSRKTASEPMMKEETFLKLYDPEFNEKIFYKKKMNFNTSGHGVIGNNLEGLISYYTAANIRNKIKHPFFISIRFSDCCSLYFNSDKIKETETRDIVLKILQTLNDYELPTKKQPKKRGANSQNSRAEATRENLLILHIKSMDHTYLDKKIAELIGKFDNEIIHLVFNVDSIPSNYQKFTDLSKVKDTYRELFDTYFKNSASIMKDCETSSLKDTHRSQFFESDLPTSKRRPKQEKPQSDEPSIKMESETSMEISPKSIPMKHFPQGNMATGFNGLMGIEQYFPFAAMNGDMFNGGQIMNFFKAFNASMQIQGLMNLERVLCNQGLMMEQARNSEAFKQKMAEMQTMKTANEKK